MDESLKQRIIGALVLISCAVIFIPMVFDPETAEQYQLSSGIPVEPARPSVSIEDPQRPEVTRTIRIEPREAYRLIGETDTQSQTQTQTQTQTQSQATDTATQAALSAEMATQEAVTIEEVDRPPQDSSADKTALTTRIRKRLQPVLADDGLPNAWVVQVASFEDKQRASSLSDDLIKKGYKAFTRSSENGSGKNTRVYVGPKLDKRDAEEIKKVLDEELDVSSLVLRFRAEG